MENLSVNKPRAERLLGEKTHLEESLRWIHQSGKLRNTMEDHLEE